MNCWQFKFWSFLIFGQILYHCEMPYVWIWTCPTYAHSSSFSGPAEIMVIMMIVDGGNNYNYNFLIPNYNYEYIYYHYQKAISDIGTEFLNFHCFATQMVFSFCQSILFSGICINCCILYAGSNKHDLKTPAESFREFACDLGFAAYETFCPRGPCGST